MKPNRIKKLAYKLTLCLLLALLQLGEFRAHALYSAGQVVTNNFSFIARRPFTRWDGTQVLAGAPVYLRDFAGRVVFLEWFAVWCPYCQAAAPQVENDIVDWYAARGGNPFGVPVLHIAVNQEARSQYQTSTDTFITDQGFGVTVNDYNASVINPVRYQFITGGQPLFVIINGVTNSPTHQPWQILVSQQSYGETEFTAQLAGYRTIIDTVQPAVIPPLMANAKRNGNVFEFNFQTQPGRSYRVLASTNLSNWTAIRTNAGSTNITLFRHTNAPAARNFYRVVTP